MHEMAIQETGPEGFARMNANNVRNVVRLPLIFVTTTWFFAGCGAHYVNRSYEDRTFPRSSLFVCPVSTDDIHISDSTVIDFLKKDFQCRSDSCVKVLRGLFYTSVRLQSDNHLAALRPECFSGSLDTFEAALKACPKKRAGLRNFKFPTEGMLSSFGISSRFLLILQHFDLSISRDVSVDVDMDGMYGRLFQAEVTVTDNKRYEFDADNVQYLVWDRERKREVAHGNFDHSSSLGRCGQSPLADGKQCDNSVFWTFHLGELVGTALSHTPFGIHKIDRKDTRELRE